MDAIAANLDSADVVRGACNDPQSRIAACVDARDPVHPSRPVHVTMRMAEHVWNLRSERSFRIIDAALRAVRARLDFRVVHFSVQGNHVHFIVEADGTLALANGMRALSIRLALGLNAMMGRSGPVFSARYHTHVPKIPAEVKNAVRHVLRNFASHAARRGERLSERYVDRFSLASRDSGEPRPDRTPQDGQASQGGSGARRPGARRPGGSRAVDPSEVPQAGRDDLSQQLDPTRKLPAPSALGVLVQSARHDEGPEGEHVFREQDGVVQYELVTFVAEEG
jgi:REP-associated tyrosine transposase